MLDDLGENTDRIITTLASIATLVTAAGWLFERLQSRSKKQLNYRVHWNGSITHPEGVQVTAKLRVMLDDHEIEQPELVVIRVENTGGRLSTKDLAENPVEFAFGGREIRRAVVGATYPKNLYRDFGALGDVTGEVDADATTLILPPVGLGHGHRYKLSVLLAGDHAEVTGTWGGGTLVPEAPRVRRSRRALILGGATLALLGLVIGLLIVPDRTSPAPTVAIACHRGKLTVNGSTALKPAIERLADVFKARCRSAHPDVEAQIVVNESSSGSALEELIAQGRNAPKARRSQLVMYDGAAADPDRYLARHTLGIGVFAVVAHKGTIPDVGLSLGEVRTLFNGAAARFSVVKGADLPVVLISRQDGSGTRTTFEDRVLAGPTRADVNSPDCNTFAAGKEADYMHCVKQTTEDVLDNVDELSGTIGYADAHAANSGKYPNIDIISLNGHQPDEDGVANDTYPFWAVENLYTFGEPAEGTLLKDFLAFVAGDEARSLLTKEFGYVPCSHFSNEEAAKACASK